MSFAEFAQIAGNLGELLGAFAVFVTLAYLAVQVRQSNRLAITQTNYASATALRDELGAFLDPLTLSGALLKSCAQPDELTPIEELNMDAWLQLSFHMREAEYYEWCNGTLADERWGALREIMRINLQSAWAARSWWKSIGRVSKSNEFAEYVDALTKDESPARSYQELIHGGPAGD